MPLLTLVTVADDEDDSDRDRFGLGDFRDWWLRWDKPNFRNGSFRISS